MIYVRPVFPIFSLFAVLRSLRRQTVSITFVMTSSRLSRDLLRRDVSGCNVVRDPEGYSSRKLARLDRISSATRVVDGTLSRVSTRNLFGASAYDRFFGRTTRVFTICPESRKSRVKAGAWRVGSGPTTTATAARGDAFPTPATSFYEHENGLDMTRIHNRLGHDPDAGNGARRTRLSRA